MSDVGDLFERLVAWYDARQRVNEAYERYGEASAALRKAEEALAKAAFEQRTIVAPEYE